MALSLSLSLSQLLFEYSKRFFHFAGIFCEHGAWKDEGKDGEQEMERFVNSKTHIMITTTV